MTRTHLVDPVQDQTDQDEVLEVELGDTNERGHQTYFLSNTYDRCLMTPASNRNRQAGVVQQQLLALPNNLQNQRDKLNSEMWAKFHHTKSSSSFKVFKVEVDLWMNLIFCKPLLLQIKDQD